MINHVSFTGYVYGSFADGNSKKNTTEKDDTAVLTAWNNSLNDPKTMKIAKLKNSNTISIKNIDLTTYDDKFGAYIQLDDKNTNEGYVIRQKEDITPNNNQLFSNLLKQFSKLKETLSGQIYSNCVKNFLPPEK